MDLRNHASALVLAGQQQQDEALFWLVLDVADDVPASIVRTGDIIIQRTAAADGLASNEPKYKFLRCEDIVAVLPREVYDVKQANDALPSQG